MIIVVASVKGGTGKTTLSTNLSVIRAQNASDVLLVDADTQKSAFDFSAVREEENHQPEITSTVITGKSTSGELRKLVPKFDDIIVDVGGRDTSTLRSSLLVADVLVIPFLPSQLDAWALDLMNSIVGEVLPLNERLKVIPILNKVDTNPKVRLAEEASEFAKDLEHIDFSNISIGNRVAFRRSVADGLAVNELKNKDLKAEEEIINLYKGIFGNA